MSDSLQEQVVVHGRTLYAPVIACSPLHPETYPLARREAWAQMVKNLAQPPSVYPGSVFVPCEDCAVEVVVGLRAQEAVEIAVSFGLRAHVVCMFCAVERGPSTVRHFGNEWTPEEDRPATV